MKLKHWGFLIFGSSLASFIAPSAILPFLTDDLDTENKLEERKAQFGNNQAAHSVKVYDVSYIKEAKAAIVRKLKERNFNDSFEISKIVFTSQKSKWVAGQRQVVLSFTYELKYKGQAPEKLNGSIHLASDEAGKLFDSSIGI